MKYFLLISAVVLLTFSVVASKADLLDCDDKILPSLSDIPGIGPKVASSEENTGDKVKDVLKGWGCKFKKGATEFGQTVKEKTKEWNEDVREGFKKLKEKAKDVHSKLENKFHDFKDHLSKDSAESLEVTDKKFFLENIEVLNPDLLKTDQECGHGHILDSLGNCKRLRK